MSWVRAGLLAARVGLVGLIVFIAVRQFAGSAAADLLQEYGERYLRNFPLPVPDLFFEQAGLLAALALVALPAASALSGHGPRSMLWLILSAAALQAPAALGTSWIDWFRFIDQAAVKALVSYTSSPLAASVAAVATAVAAYLLWSVDRLQADTARMLSLDVPEQDELRMVSAQATTVGAVLLGATALSGLAFGIAWITVRLGAGSLEARTWLALGAAGIALATIVYTIATTMVARRR